MKRNTKYDKEAQCYLLVNKKLQHPSINELIQLIGCLEDVIEQHESLNNTKEK